MSIRNLEHLLAPQSVAVIGASDRLASVGLTVMRNLLAGGFKGPIWPVNPKHAQVAGQPCFEDVRALPGAPDMALICTPPATVPGLIAELGDRGTRAAVVLTAGLATATDRRGRPLTRLMLQAARPHMLRILGPNCVGLLVPGIGLNASFAHTGTAPGPLAFVSQSGALVTAVLDWANSRGIGFSHFVSVGDRLDIDLGDLIDYLGSDPGTRAILLYVESVKTPRKFLSAARAAARNKPVIVVKSGRAPASARAAATHSGVLAGADDVFDAAIRRAGMLRVENLLDLFVAVETLARGPRFDGDRLLIVTNGGGAGVLAADAVALGGARLAELSADTVARLDRLLPPTWSRANPVDLIGDAPVERYVEALKVLGDAAETDAVLFIHAPSAIVPADAIAEACVPVVHAAKRPVLSCWLGAATVESAWRRFAQAGIASYHTPEEAVRAFVHSVTYRRNQAQLLQAPPTYVDPAADRDRARGLLRAALAAGTAWLSETQVATLLAAYGIPVVETRSAASVEEARAAADAIGYPVALKIVSPDIVHRSEVRGVALDVDSADEVGAAAVAMLRRARHLQPQARLEGFTVQPMVRRPHVFELLVGMAVDPQFGPVVVFGHGGTAVEIIGDRAVALPPLNAALAREVVSRTRIARLLAGYRNLPPADLDAICRVLIGVSQMVIDLPELAELDINPLLANSDGVIALDARVRVRPPSDARPGEARLAIRPYPRELEETYAWGDGEMLLRPIRPDDDVRHLDFLQRLDPDDIRMRVFSSRREIARSELARLTQIDYEREMAFIALAPGPGGQPETIGTVRAVADADNARAEFGIIVRSDLKGRGLGLLLLRKMIRYCRDRGTGEMVGDVLRENASMLRLAQALGFQVSAGDDEGYVRVRLPLR